MLQIVHNVNSLLHKEVFMVSGELLATRKLYEEEQVKKWQIASEACPVRDTYFNYMEEEIPYCTLHYPDITLPSVIENRACEFQTCFARFCHSLPT